jgi:CRP/FNR family transcriptional regulator, cyclic AMP receptor protein
VSEAARGSTKAIVAGLKKSPLLSQLPDRHLKRLAGYAKVRDIPAGETVVKRGEKGLGFYVILDGRVQVKKGSTNVAKLGPGDFFGELALYNDRPRSADVVTTEPTTVVVLSRWEFWGFATDRPDVLKVILAEMARRLEQTSKIAAA